jgi:hypothetical protein
MFSAFSGPLRRIMIRMIGFGEAGRDMNYSASAEQPLQEDRHGYEAPQRARHLLSTLRDDLSEAGLGKLLGECGAFSIYTAGQHSSYRRSISALRDYFREVQLQAGLGQLFGEGGALGIYTAGQHSTADTREYIRARDSGAEISTLVSVEHAQHGHS